MLTRGCKSLVGPVPSPESFAGEGSMRCGMHLRVAWAREERGCTVRCALGGGGLAGIGAKKSGIRVAGCREGEGAKLGRFSRTCIRR